MQIEKLILTFNSEAEQDKGLEVADSVWGPAAQAIIEAGWSKQQGFYLEFKDSIEVEKLKTFLWELTPKPF